MLVQQTLGLHRRVDLRRCDTGVPEHFLDRAQVRPTAQQVRRKRVPQQVWFHVLHDAGPTRVFLDDQPQRDPRERATAVA